MRDLFLRQSYLDSWLDYENSLVKNRIIKWDYIILTASNEEQAKTFRLQIKQRIEDGNLPKSIHYCILPDPDGKRVGSGGATLNAVKYVKEHSGDFKNKRMLVIHSGGDSKRVPQYSACGKLFSPVPRQLPDGRRSTLFDEFIIAMSGVPSRIKDGMLVLSGDVLLLFNPVQIDFQFEGAAAISIKENVQIGKNHGVFLNDGKGNVKRFLHKISVAELTDIGAVNEHENVDLDTGAVLMDSNMVNSLYSLISTQEKFGKFVNEKVRLSFYGDFLYPLAHESTLKQYYEEKTEGDFSNDLTACRTEIWDALHKYKMKMICLSPAEFIHFGTTKELLNLVTKEISNYEFLDWSGKVVTNIDNISKFSCSNSFVESTSTIGQNSYIEDSYVLGNTKIGENCVISNIMLKDIVIPDNTVIHGLKLKDGSFVVRKYPTDCNPKVNDFWNENLYPACDTMEQALISNNGEKLSLSQSFNNADTSYILNWQKQLDDEIRVHNFIINIKNRVFVDDALKVFGKKGITQNQFKILMNYVEDCDFDIKIRIYYYLSRAGIQKEQLESKCFETIQKTIFDDVTRELKYNKNFKITKDKVDISLPLRVNWGGGWSDTPPYCNEHGGTVLNACIKLRGELSVLVRLKKLDNLQIEFESADSGVFGIVKTMREIQDCHNPFDPFALHKAALIACGIIPINDDIPLEHILEKIGGGIYLSTQVLGVPRGSGLGTSSILAGACIKGIYEFLNEKISDNSIYSQVLCMEQIMSTGGGWQDQVGGLVEGIKFITTTKGITQNILVEKIKISEKTKQELQDRYVLIYTGQRRLARNLLREVVGRYIASNPNSIEVLNKIQRVAALMKFELEKGNIDGFAQLLNDHWELSKMLDSGCTNTCIDQIFMSIEDMIDGKFIAGAGGGGFLQVILKQNCTRQDLQKRLYNVFQDSGVEVWDSEFVF